MFIEKVISTLVKFKVPFAVAGGYAVALHGAVRGTVDIDIVIRLRKDDFLAAERALKGIGLVSRLPVTAEEVFQFRKEYVEKRNLMAWSFVNPDRPIEIVDILIAEDLSKHKIARMRAGKITVPVLALNDLIAMKKKANRPQDREDVKALKIILEKKS